MCARCLGQRSLQFLNCFAPWINPPIDLFEKAFGGGQSLGNEDQRAEEVWPLPMRCDRCDKFWESGNVVQTIKIPIRRIYVPVKLSHTHNLRSTSEQWTRTQLRSHSGSDRVQCGHIIRIIRQLISGTVQAEGETFANWLQPKELRVALLWVS